MIASPDSTAVRMSLPFTSHVRRSTSTTLMAERRCSINAVGGGLRCSGWLRHREWQFHIHLDCGPRPANLDQVQLLIQNPPAPTTDDPVTIFLSPDEDRPMTHQILSIWNWLPKKQTNWLTATGSSHGQTVRDNTPDDADRTGIPPLENRIPDSHQTRIPYLSDITAVQANAEVSLVPRVVV